MPLPDEGSDEAFVVNRVGKFELTTAETVVLHQEGQEGAKARGPEYRLENTITCIHVDHGVGRIYFGQMQGAVRWGLEPLTQLDACTTRIC